MARKKTNLLLLTLMLIFAAAANTYADVSDAGVLFLRIPVGSRAAGMGEAHVAATDDVFSMHWNPAGLADPRMSGAWMTANIPQEYRPVTDIVAINTGGGSGRLGWEIWARTARGLVRFDNRNWHQEEVFNTKTDETVRDIVGRYFNIVDNDLLDAVVKPVVRRNSRVAYEDMEALRDEILSVVPQDYNSMDELVQGLDSAMIAYDLCRLDWERVDEIRTRLSDGLKDSLLTEVEIDRINIAVDLSLKRFIPEELIVPYSALFTGEITGLASTGERLMVGTGNGLYEYTGSIWRSHNDDASLPSMNITRLATVGGQTAIATDKGVVLHNGLTIQTLPATDELPEGAVTAIGGNSPTDIYVVMDNDLYHYDGVTWANSFAYTVTLDDSAETITDRFLIYGSEAERALYLAKLEELGAPDEAPVEESDETGEDIPVADSADTAELQVEETSDEVVENPIIAAMEGGISAADNMLVSQTLQAKIPTPEQLATAEAGTLLRIPYLASLKGEVTSIHVTPLGHIWLGTSYGIVHFDGRSWNLPGYREHTVEVGETLESMVVNRRQTDSWFQSRAYDNTPPPVVATDGDDPEGDVGGEPTETAPTEITPTEITPTEITPPMSQVSLDYLAALMDINDLESESLDSGQVIRIYAFPNAYPITDIRKGEEVLYFSTPGGLIYYDGLTFGRSDVKDMGHKEALDVEARGGQLWFVGQNQIVMNSEGHSELGFMTAKLVPELADDIFFNYFGFVTHVNGLGTVGLDFKYLTYGEIPRTGEGGVDLGTFEPKEMAFTLAYGTRLTDRLAGGLAFKYINSHLTDQGAGDEKGSGTGWSIAVDFGLQYRIWNRMTIGAAVSNLGPDITYVDAAQADALPRNLAIGFSYQLKTADQFKIMTAFEVNKGLVGVNDSFKQEIREMIFSGGLEAEFLNLFSIRTGYLYDQEGRQKYATVGFGLNLLDFVEADFGYNPGDVKNAGSANQMRMSLVLHL